MLRRIFQRTRAKAPPSGPPGRRAYAIGDVHGCLDLLDELLARIEEDNARRDPAQVYLVLLGDLIDRGPDSRGVIERFVSTPPSFATPIFIKGNHEEFLLDVLAGDYSGVRDWLSYGGYECAASYGVSKGWTLNNSPEAIVERLRANVPQSHARLLEQMADSFRFGDYLFVHAGIRPTVALAEQTGRDLRWIRDGFLDDLTDHGLIVVHGHTIVPGPQQHPNRIALDTGAYQSGVLTALGLEREERWFLEVRKEA